MSDVSQGPGWWQASDGKWYRPEQHPSFRPPPPPPPEWRPPTMQPGVDAHAVVGSRHSSAAQTTNGLAIASLVLSLLWLAGIGSIRAIIFAIRGRTQIRESSGQRVVMAWRSRALSSGFLE